MVEELEMSSNYRANECWKAEISAAGKVTAESLVLITRACSYIFWSFCTAGQKILPNAPLNILLGVGTSILERVVQLRMIPISLFKQEPRCTNKHKSYFLFLYFFLLLISLLVSVCNFTTRHRRAGSLRLPRSLHRDWQCLNLPSHFFSSLLQQIEAGASATNEGFLPISKPRRCPPLRLPAWLSWADDRLLSLCLCAGKLLCFVNSLPLFQPRQQR